VLSQEIAYKAHKVILKQLNPNQRVTLSVTPTLLFTHWVNVMTEALAYQQSKNLRLLSEAEGQVAQIADFINASFRRPPMNSRLASVSTGNNPQLSDSNSNGDSGSDPNHPLARMTALNLLQSIHFTPFPTTSTEIQSMLHHTNTNNITDTKKNIKPKKRVVIQEDNNQTVEGDPSHSCDSSASL
jgi:hypothetical protein